MPSLSPPIESAAKQLDALDWHAFDHARGVTALQSAIAVVIGAEPHLEGLGREDVRAIERLFQAVTRAQSSLLEVELDELAKIPLDEGRAIRIGILRRQATVLTAELQRVLWIAHHRLFAQGHGAAS